MSALSEAFIAVALLGRKRGYHEYRVPVLLRVSDRWGALLNATPRFVTSRGVVSVLDGQVCAGWLSLTGGLMEVEQLSAFRAALDAALEPRRLTRAG